MKNIDKISDEVIKRIPKYVREIYVRKNMRKVDDVRLDMFLKKCEKKTEKERMHFLSDAVKVHYHHVSRC